MAIEAKENKYIEICSNCGGHGLLYKKQVMREIGAKVGSVSFFDRVWENDLRLEDLRANSYSDPTRCGACNGAGWVFKDKDIEVVLSLWGERTTQQICDLGSEIKELKESRAKWKKK